MVWVRSLKVTEGDKQSDERAKAQDRKASLGRVHCSALQPLHISDSNGDSSWRDWAQRLRGCEPYQAIPYHLRVADNQPSAVPDCDPQLGGITGRNLLDPPTGTANQVA